MELIQLGSLSRAFKALVDSRYSDLDDESKRAKQQELMLECVNLFAGNEKFWDVIQVPKYLVEITLSAQLALDNNDVGPPLKLMMDSIPCIDYEPVKKNIIITPGRTN